ncbi:MAG TPA: PIN domain-containing protein [Ginsengibacter sp.]|nr:PIN domain-containing protein [Ginsengibacter sp.]
MNGNKFFLDTNIIIYILNGDKIISDYLSQKIFYTSIVCEIELFESKSLTPKEENQIRNFLQEFKIISIDYSIKELAISLLKKYPLKIPDLIIAATAVSMDVPLITSDKGFKQITELEIDFYNK